MDTDDERMNPWSGTGDQKVRGLRDLDNLTERIIGCAYAVSNCLGVGFLGKVYENALAYKLRKNGLVVMQQHPFRVIYDGREVGYYEADIVVEDKVIVELKAVRALNEIHQAQCLNYLKASGMRICLLMNFATPRIQIKRIIR
jgi:GxxExxY protein